MLVARTVKEFAMQNSIDQIVAHGARILALIVFAWPMRSAALIHSPYEVTAAGGCKVWVENPYDNKTLKASWTGKCDEQGYATGHGDLFVNKDGFFRAFIGEMRAGKVYSGSFFLNGFGPNCIPPQNFGQMTDSEVESWSNAHQDALGKRRGTKGYAACRQENRWYFSKEKVSSGGSYSADTVWYFGPDAERIANQTGIPAFAAYLRSVAPGRSRAPKNSTVNHAPKSTDDACTKTALVNGKKFCVE